MQKLILTVFLAVILLGYKQTTVQAADPCQCTDWEIVGYTCKTCLEWDPIYGCTKEQEGWCQQAVCQGTTCQSCGPGYYACNNVCCAIGSGGGCECGVNAQGQCRSCNQPSCDWEYRVNCPDGAQRSPPQNLYIKAGGKPTMTM